MKRSFLEASRTISIIVDMMKLVWRAHRLSFLGLLVIEVFQGLMPLAYAWVTKLLFDLLVESFTSGSFTQLPQNVLFLLGLQVFLSIFSQVAVHLGGYLYAELTRRLKLDIQSGIYRKMNSLQGMAPFETPRFYDAMQMAEQGAQFGPSQILSVLTNLIRSMITLVSFLGVLIAFSPFLAGLVILAALPQLYAQIKMGAQRYNMAAKTTPKERAAYYYGNLLSGAGFAKEVRLFNLGEYFLKRFQKLTIEVQSIERSQQQREVGWKSGLSLISSLVSSGAFILVVLRAFAGRLSLGDVTLYTSAVGTIQGALYDITSAVANISESVLFFTRYTDLLAAPQPIHIPVTTRAVSRLVIGIEFHNVSFRYSDEHAWVLRNINLTIPAGQTLALVGLNGAGKTTLIKLLTRMYDPTEGSILWDRVDIRELDPIALRTYIGAIFQDFVHFDLTAYENIALGNITELEKEDRLVTEEFVRRAAQKAGVGEAIEKLPQGYQTVLSRWLVEDGEGVDLSGGQWQKIALARMLMRDADFLILDEPTAALDPQAEYEMYSKFIDLVAGKTSLLISHRFSTVRMADMIAVLEDGKILEYASHDQLISQGGTYAKLYAMQADRYK